jgi:hypothetical protein
MIVKYRILNKNEEENTIEIRYFTDVITEDMLSTFYDGEGNIVRTKDGYPERCRTDVNFHINKSKPTVKDIEDIAENNAPTEWLKTKEDILLNKVKINLSNIDNMIGKVDSFESNVSSSIDQPPIPVTEFDIDTVLTPNNVSKLISSLKKAKVI